MLKKEILKEIKASVAHVHSVQKLAIEPYEEKVTNLLMQLYPKVTKAVAEDWMLDIIYNNPKDALKIMDKVYGS